MPELPEVECLTLAVREAIEGFTLVSAHFFRKDLRDPIPIDLIQSTLVGRKIEQVTRRSKYMIWSTRDDCALFHLGMTGNMFAHPDEAVRKKHTHAVFAFEGKSPGSKAKSQVFLHFVDPRRFGRIGHSSVLSLDEHVYMKSLGVEPFLKDLAAYLFQESRTRHTTVKSFVMDAEVVVGVGNIYASEALFLAKIAPLRTADSLTKADCSVLAKCIKQVLTQAIKSGGTSFRDYRHADGEKGGYTSRLKVYGRAKEPCLICGNPISLVRITGRSSFFCTFCQH